MADIKPVQKILRISDFKPDEIVRDRVGNYFITREGVAAVLETSLSALKTTYKKKGLMPMDRYIKGVKPYMLEDVVLHYNAREK